MKLAVKRPALATGGPVDESSLAPLIPTEPLTNWVQTPGGYQSAAATSHRLGGDANSGVSGLVDVRFPDGPMSASTNVTFAVDIGISIVGQLPLQETAELLRDALMVATTGLPDAVSDAMAPTAQVTGAEVYLRAATIDGHNQNRPNDLGRRIDLSSLGPASGTVSTYWGYGEEIPTAFSERDAAELVTDAIERFAYSNGYLEPDEGLVLLRGFLGLPR